MGNAHQKRKSDHSSGNAFNLTHESKHGVDCEVIWNHHMHVSIRASGRHDMSSWPWSGPEAEFAIGPNARTAPSQ